MPLVHECQALGCHKVVSANHHYCDYHYQQHKAKWQATLKKNGRDRKVADKVYNHTRRDQEANSFYHGKTWTTTRNFVKARDYMTSGLSGRVLSDHDVIVDHIVPRRLCQNPLDTSNLWLLSRAEHNRKTEAEEKMSNAQLLHVSRDFWKQKLTKSSSKS